MNKPIAVALHVPDMNILVDMLNYGKNIYLTGNNPLPEVCNSMINLVKEVERQVEEQTKVEAPKGLINE